MASVRTGERSEVALETTGDASTLRADGGERAYLVLLHTGSAGLADAMCADRDFVSLVEQGYAEIAAGRTSRLEDVKRRLGDR